jgi:hypothetical protein
MATKTDLKPIETDGQRCSTVISSINSQLRAAGIEFGENEFSDTSYIDTQGADKYASTLWPSNARWIVCHAVPGSNEGIYIHIMALFPSGYTNMLPNTWKWIASAKVWDWPNANQIVAATSEMLAKSRWQ